MEFCRSAALFDVPTLARRSKEAQLGSPRDSIWRVERQRHSSSAPRPNDSALRKKETVETEDLDIDTRGEERERERIER